MDFFSNARIIRLRSHLDKYLYADEDEEKVRQSREGCSRNVKWEVEYVEGNNHVIRLKSCYGRYLTATASSYPTGMIGKKVIQTVCNKVMDLSSINWEPIRDRYQVKFRISGRNYLRANGGPLPWRNTITHDVPNRTMTQEWIMWIVDVLDINKTGSFADSSSTSSSVSMASVKSTSSLELGCELLRNVKTIRLKSHHGKYLVADSNEESVSQDINGASSRKSKWTVELVQGGKFLHLKSCYGTFLTASNSRFITGLTGKKVLQTSLSRLEDSGIDWQPIKVESEQPQKKQIIKLMTLNGNFLRANRGIPPYKNSVTHDTPVFNKTQNWVFWYVEIVELQPQPQPQSVVEPEEVLDHGYDSNQATKLKLQLSDESFVRKIYYQIDGEDDDEDGWYSFVFKGNTVEELTEKLREKTKLENISVCLRSAIDDQLYPLRRHLPRSNAEMHVVVVHQTSPKESRYKLASANEGNKHQHQWFLNACRGIPQVMRPPDAAGTPVVPPASAPSSNAEDIELAMAIKASIQSAMQERPPLLPDTHLTSGESSANNLVNSVDNHNHNGWGRPSTVSPVPPSKATTSRWHWLDKPAEDACNGWGVIETGSSSNQAPNNPPAAAVSVTSEIPETVSVPSAPPIPEGIDISPVNFFTPIVDHDNKSAGKGAVKDDVDTSSCVICLDAPVEGACIPCGHMAGCMSCLKEIKATKWGCPVCRAKIDQVIRLYTV